MARGRKDGIGRGGAEAGFTLIEALVAFTVLAFATVVIQSGVVQSVAGIGRAETRIEAERLARTLMNGPVTAESFGRRSGRTGAYDWTVDLTPLGSQFGTPQRGEGRGFVPARMTVTVAPAETGRNAARVTTIRVVAPEQS